MAEKECIEREAAYKACEAYFSGVCVYDVSASEVINDFENVIEAVPTADVAPVRHGHWIRPDVPNTRSYKWQCSECGQTAYWLHYGNRGNKNIICKYNYCPNCGAKMDGDTNGS